MRCHLRVSLVARTRLALQPPRREGGLAVQASTSERVLLGPTAPLWGMYPV